jgi:ubiquitin carboxyl-terminal hydrolase 7
LFPRGNNQNEFASLYLDLTNAKANNPDEYACAQFVLCISKPSDPTKHIRNNAQHRFTSDESDWGFTRFIPLEELINGADSLMENDCVRVSAIIRVVKDTTGILWHNFIK